MFPFFPRLYNRVLSYNAAIVFDFYIQLVTRQNPPAEFQDFCESIGAESMFHIASDMCLQQRLFLSASFAPAINKVSDHMADFRYMCIGGDIISIWQYEPRKRPRVFAHDVF